MWYLKSILVEQEYFCETKRADAFRSLLSCHKRTFSGFELDVLFFMTQSIRIYQMHLKCCTNFCTMCQKNDDNTDSKYI